MQVPNPRLFIERPKPQTIIPQTQQNLYTKQQIQNSQPQGFITTERTSQGKNTQEILQPNQEFAEQDQTDQSYREEQPRYEIISREDYLSMQQEIKQLKLDKELLSKQLVESIAKLKNSPQITADEETRKYTEDEAQGPESPCKKKDNPQIKFSEKKTEETRTQISDQQEDQLTKQLEKYKLLYENQLFRSNQYLQNLEETNTKIDSFQQSNKKYRDICCRLQRSEKQYMTKLQKLQKRYSNLKQLCDQAESSNNQLTNQMEEERQYVKSVQERIRDKQNEVQGLQREIVELLQKIRQHQQFIAQKDRIIQKSTLQNQSIKSLQDKISEKQNLIAQKEQMINKLQSQKKVLQFALKSSEKALEQLKEENKKLKLQKDTQKSRLEAQIKAAKMQKQALAKDYSSLQQLSQKQKEKNEKQRKEKEAQKQRLEKQINDYKQKVKQSEQMLAEKQKIYSSKLQQMEKSLMLKTQQNNQMKYHTERYKAILEPIYQLSNIQLNENNLSQAAGQQMYHKILRGSYFQESIILNQTNSSKTYFLSKQISTFLSIPNFKAQMIFKFDPINPQNNFFKYITGVKNILILIKLANDTMVGGFTVFPFEQEVQRPGKGFIFSLTAERVFKMKNQPRVPVTNSDPFFLIFGSSQLRIKYNEKKFFSNFGVNTATFDSNGFSKQQFLGVQQNISEVDFQTYEIFVINPGNQ